MRRAFISLRSPGRGPSACSIRARFLGAVSCVTFRMLEDRFGWPFLFTHTDVGTTTVTSNTFPSPSGRSMTEYRLPTPRMRALKWLMPTTTPFSTNTSAASKPSTCWLNCATMVMSEVPCLWSGADSCTAGLSTSTSKLTSSIAQRATCPVTKSRACRHRNLVAALCAPAGICTAYSTNPFLPPPSHNANDAPLGFEYAGASYVSAE
mmetsp:Transcript_11936/g.20153  ORF Transcript_11936/g.20153 Transcript_11936/m.20153 type:complete len:207 (-) Transcript_11936:125-745(-)